MSFWSCTVFPLISQCKQELDDVAIILDVSFFYAFYFFNIWCEFALASQELAILDTENKWEYWDKYMYRWLSGKLWYLQHIMLELP